MAERQAKQDANPNWAVFSDEQISQGGGFEHPPSKKQLKFSVVNVELVHLLSVKFLS